MPIPFDFIHTTIHAMRTSNRFFSLTPWIAATAIASLCFPAPVVAAENVIAAFDKAESLALWKSVNDGVMGGVSRGGFKRSDQETLVFSGELSLENNGGFASIRMVPGDLKLAGTSGVAIKARGDGRTYWVDLRLANQPAASSYRAYLATTAGEWKETRIPYQEFKLQAFGEDLPTKAINPESINSVGFTIADKKEGEFSLEIASIKAVNHLDSAKLKNENTLVNVAKAAGGFETLLAAVTAADFVGALSGDGPLTVLAPTDEAFAKLPAGTVDTLLKPENREKLVAILKNHLIPGQIPLAKALDAREAASLHGSKISFQFKDGRILVGNATLLQADISASNGMLHVIDQVLIPPSKSNEPLTPSQLVELAIERGVPVFNDGDFEGCAAIYEVTVEALRTMESIPKSSRKILLKALTEAREEKSPQDQAWILRKAIDKTWANLNQSN